MMKNAARSAPLMRFLVNSFFFLCTFQSIHSTTTNSAYPRIPRLVSSDPVFSQYSDDVLTARMALASGKKNENLPLAVYSYTVQKDETLLTIAARCSIPYDSIASLNRIATMQEGLVGKTLLLPSLPGLYLSEQAENSFENLLLSSFNPNDSSIITFSIREKTKRLVHCVPDATFNGTVRSFFLTPSFHFPLPVGVLTSSFGMRNNPVTGKRFFHRGVDLAAPRGTSVFSCADGIITEKGSDPVYGNYVIIRHDGNRESLYGHMQTIKIELHQKIKSATIIGTVGSTGQSTGPHLHFEIHENGVPKNPSGFIKGN